MWYFPKHTLLNFFSLRRCFLNRLIQLPLFTVLNDDVNALSKISPDSCFTQVSQQQQDSGSAKLDFSFTSNYNCSIILRIGPNYLQFKNYWDKGNSKYVGGRFQKEKVNDLNFQWCAVWIWVLFILFNCLFWYPQICMSYVLQNKCIGLLRSKIYFNLERNCNIDDLFEHSHKFNGPV